MKWKSRLVVWAIMAASVAWWIAGGIASGEKFPTYELDKAYEAFKDPKKAADLERAVGQLVTARNLAKLEASVPGKATFYLEKYIPWKLTQPETLPELPQIIEGLLKNLDRVQRMEGEGMRTILKGTYLGMKTIAEGNYSPAARINAINALSRINVRPLDIANQRPPQPLSYSFEVLMKIYANEKEVDGVRAAALHGLHRFANLAFPFMKAEEKKQLVDEMNKLLASDPPEARDPEAHAYLQRYAVDLINLFRNPRDASLGTQLISISTKEEAPELIALYSASQLGDFALGLQEEAKDPAPIVKMWSLRAFQSIESEITRLEALERPLPAATQPPDPKDFLQKSRQSRRGAAPAAQEGGGMGMAAGPSMRGEMGGGRMDMGDMGMDMGMDMGDMGMGMGMAAPPAKPQPPEINISRRYLTDVLQQLLRGATGSRTGTPEEKPSGLLAAAAAPNRAALQKWVDQIKKIVTAVNNDSLDDRIRWIEMLQDQRISLGALAGLEVERPAAEDGEDAGGPQGFPGGLPGGGLPGFGGPAAAPPVDALPGLPGT